MTGIATLGGIGRIRHVPEIWASLAALGAAWLLLVLGGPWLLVVAILLLIAGAIPAIRAEVAVCGNEDVRHIVVDEVAGQWVALLPVAFGAWSNEVAYLALWPGWIAAFLLFRLLDLWKPGPVGWVHRRGGVQGVLADDLIAGLLAAVMVTLLAGIAHAVLLA